MIVLDTNVLSELMRAEPAQVVVDWVDRQAISTLFVTTLTLAEIRFGIAALPAGRRRAALRSAFEDGIRPVLADRVLSFDEEASRRYADLRARALERDSAIGDVDALIAAIALAHDFLIATRDVGPFVAVDVRVVDPFAVP